MVQLTKGYEGFVVQIDQACKEFPKLSAVIKDDGTQYLKGELDVIDKAGKFWESFNVEIHHTDEFPLRFPLLYETGGKIPRIGDWHVNEDSGTCCITVLPEEILVCKEGISVVDFIRNEALPYFFNQTFRRAEGYYPNGEYAHGLAGIFQFYNDVLLTQGDLRKAILLMLFIAKGQRPGRTHTCFCGSKEKFRRCHRGAFDQLEVIGSVNLLQHAYLMAKAAGYEDMCSLIEKG